MHSFAYCYTHAASIYFNQFSFQMFTIGDIQSDRYHGWLDDFSAWTLLVYQEFGRSPVISIPNADLLSVIQVFNTIIACQNCISTNVGKKIALFGYDENMQRWLLENIALPNNLETVKIFCSSDDQLFVTGWLDNYKRRFRNVDFEIITFEELNHRLLTCALEYLRSLRIALQDSLIINELNHDFEQICSALEKHGLEKANMENEGIDQGEEAQDYDSS